MRRQIFQKKKTKMSHNINERTPSRLSGVILTLSIKKPELQASDLLKDLRGASRIDMYWGNVPPNTKQERNAASDFSEEENQNEPQRK